MLVNTIKRDVCKIFLNNTEWESVNCEPFSEFYFKRIINLCKFNTKCYNVKDFGKVLFLRSIMLNNIEMLTISFTPLSGKRVSYLLMDIVNSNKKQTVFVEYYNCTGKEINTKLLDVVFNRYKGLPDYNEKYAWYVDKREPYSLIKSFNKDNNLMMDIIRDTITAYKKTIEQATIEEDNLTGLDIFRDDMFIKGNPSRKIMVKTMGVKQYSDFHYKFIMPVR